MGADGSIAASGRLAAGDGAEKCLVLLQRHAGEKFSTADGLCFPGGMRRSGKSRCRESIQASDLRIVAERGNAKFIPMELAGGAAGPIRRATL